MLSAPGIWVKAGGMTQVDEVHSGDSYISHSEWRLHFGLGAAKAIDEIEARRPSGKTEMLTKVPADRVITITEGRK